MAELGGDDVGKLCTAAAANTDAASGVSGVETTVQRV
jgi:hypothetical protein